jgi:hypothetical protein
VWWRSWVPLAESEGGGSGKGTSLVHARPSRRLPRACIQLEFTVEQVLGQVKRPIINSCMSLPTMTRLRQGLPSIVNTTSPLLCCPGYQSGRGLHASVMGTIIVDARRRPRKPKSYPMPMPNNNALVGTMGLAGRASKCCPSSGSLHGRCRPLAFPALAHKGSKLCQWKVPPSCLASQKVRSGRFQRPLSQPGFLEGEKQRRGCQNRQVVGVTSLAPRLSQIYFRLRLCKICHWRLGYGQEHRYPRRTWHAQG